MKNHPPPLNCQGHGIHSLSIPHPVENFLRLLRFFAAIHLAPRVVYSTLRKIAFGVHNKNLHLPGRAEQRLCPELLGGAAAPKAFGGTARPSDDVKIFVLYTRLCFGAFLAGVCAGLWQCQWVYKDVKRIVYPLAAWLVVFGPAWVLSAQESQLAGSGGHHKIEVRDEALGQKMAGAGARLIADYGGYKLYDAPDSMTNLPGDKAELRDDYNVIALNVVRLDTTQPAAQALRKKAGNFSGNHMHLIQFAGPVQSAWRKDLLEAGVKIVSYIPHNTYLVYGDAASVARVQALAATASHVQWEGAYADEYKIHPAAKAGAAKGDQFAIQLMSDEAANAVTLQLIDRLKRAPRFAPAPGAALRRCGGAGGPADLPQIAARPDVVSIQPYGRPRKLCERQDQIVAGNVSAQVPSGPGYLNWLAGRGFTQAQFQRLGFFGRFIGQRD